MSRILANRIMQVVRAEVPSDLPRDEVTSLAITSARAIIGQLPRRADKRDGPVMEMMVARPSYDTAASISLANLVRVNPFNPRMVKEALAASGAMSSVAMMGAGDLLAFIAAVTTLSTRNVPRNEAMTLHLAWRIARADRRFSFADIMAHATSLRDDYEVEKTSETDVLSYLNNLERAGSLETTHNGYRLKERVILLNF